MKSALRQNERMLTYGEPQGEADFRETLSDYIRERRNILCSPDDIVVGASFQSLLQILCPLIHEVYPEAELINVERIGAVASASLIKNAVLSVAIAGALILLYISIRFEFHFGISSIICLLHDVLIMMAFVCIFRVEINSSFIAAVLTIVGYSINNTIVVFDRMREIRKADPAIELDELVDSSLRKTLTRSLYTSATTLVTIVILFILGPSSIKEFAFPIIVGLVAGTYSSLFLAAPIWDMMVRRSKKGIEVAAVPMDKQAKKAEYEKNKNKKAQKAKRK